jgi:hypothetical protein
MSNSRVTKRQREAVIRRANGCCEYCRSQVKYSSDPFVVDHIFPKSLGGQTTMDNLALSCNGCNGVKSTKTEAYDTVRQKFVPLFHPRKDKWAEHFTWDESWSHMIGLTPIGRATIKTLKLNRPHLVNFRLVLFEVGNHPPELPEE